MFPTLGHLISYLVGREIVFPIPTFGFMVVLALIAAILWTQHEFRRYTALGRLPTRQVQVLVGTGVRWGDVLVVGLVGFLLGWKLGYIFRHPEEFQLAPDQTIFSGQGEPMIGVLVALLLGGWTAWRQWRTRLPRPQEKTVTVTPADEVLDMALIAVLAGSVGAKLFHALEYPREFLEDPAGMLFSTGGFTFYGGLLAGALAVIWYARRRGWHLATVADAIAPSVLLGYAIGRIGCHLAGDGDWGIPSGPKPQWLSWLPDSLWGFTYPHNVLNEGQPIPGCEGLYCFELPVPVFPTPIYETAMSLVAFLIVVLVSRQWALRVPGIAFSVFLILAGVERFLIEQIRVNPMYRVGGLEFTQAEAISVLMIVVGVLLLVWLIVRVGRKGAEKTSGARASA